MDPSEVYWLIDARRPQRRYGSQSETEVAELVGELRAMGAFNAG